MILLLTSVSGRIFLLWCVYNFIIWVRWYDGMKKWWGWRGALSFWGRLVLSVSEKTGQFPSTFLNAKNWAISVHFLQSGWVFILSSSFDHFGALFWFERGVFVFFQDLKNSLGKRYMMRGNSSGFEGLQASFGVELRQFGCFSPRKT